MRRKDKEITDKAEIESIIKNAQVCRIAMYDDFAKFPYIVPMNFAYKDGILYFHSAKQGRKIDIINNNPNICFEIDTAHGVIIGEKKLCNWSMAYESVMGFGKAVINDDEQVKISALNLLIQKYSKENISDIEISSYQYPESSLKNTSIIQVKILEMTGKKSG